MLRGNLCVTKKSIPAMMKTPFERLMTMENIKNRIEKCGICPFNPNVIDCSQFQRDSKDQLIDLLLPNSEDTEIGISLHQTDFNESLPDLATVSRSFNSKLDEDIFRTAPTNNDEISLLNFGGFLHYIDDDEESLVPYSL